MPIDKNKVTDALVQIGLRLVPFLPANEIKNLIDALTRKDTEIETKVNEAIKSLGETSVIINDLERNVKERVARLKKLRDEYKDYENMTELSREQLKAISAALENTLKRNRLKEILSHVSMHLVSGAIFLVLGVVLAHPIEKAWNSLFSHGANAAVERAQHGQ